LPVPPPSQNDFGAGINLDQMWARITVPLSDSPVEHACLLTFMSDLGGGFSALNLAGSVPFGPSIDHAVWFHAPVRADEWLLFDMRPVMVGGSRGLYLGSAHNERGTLGAMVTQEVLLRNPHI
jgi:acyl-CoA thioesterase-2